ncbi:hypothetical protein AGLY_010416 [Aphis glycines]|uniref:Uncharacterized protein n=1 Tax=Aphis glycines TaxID=307491 RepID=A0A6G0TEU4_APHGL|nr:hypothetical protein AGLY_010416 [Aphis glycines]
MIYLLCNPKSPITLISSAEFKTYCTSKIKRTVVSKMLTNATISGVNDLAFAFVIIICIRQQDNHDYETLFLSSNTFQIVFELQSYKKIDLIKNWFCVKIPVFPSLFFWFFAIFLKIVKKCLLLICIMHQGYSLCHRKPPPKLEIETLFRQVMLYRHKKHTPTSFNIITKTLHQLFKLAFSIHDLILRLTNHLRSESFFVYNDTYHSIIGFKFNTSIIVTYCTASNVKRIPTAGTLYSGRSGITPAVSRLDYSFSNA